MDRRTVLFVVLSAAFLIVWWILFPPQPPTKTPAPPPGKTIGKTLPAVPASGAGVSVTPGPAPAVTAAPSSAPSLAGVGGAGVAPAERPDVPRGARIEAAAEEDVAIETPLASVHLTNRGARVVSWKLKKYLDDEGHPLELVSRAGRALDHLPLQFLLEDPGATKRLKEALYRVSRKEGDEAGAAYTEVSFTWSDGAGLAATKTLRLARGSYLAGLRFAAEAGGAPVSPTLVWGAGFCRH